MKSNYKSITNKSSNFRISHKICYCSVFTQSFQQNVSIDNKIEQIAYILLASTGYKLARICNMKTSILPLKEVFPNNTDLICFRDVTVVTDTDMTYWTYKL